ncbi:MAG TPA: hypothetical protein VGE40_13890, partial [Bacilli bacterium]
MIVVFLHKVFFDQYISSTLQLGNPPAKAGGKQEWWFKEILAPPAPANAERLFYKKEGTTC